MFDSSHGREQYLDQPLTIRISIETDDNMSRRPGHGPTSQGGEYNRARNDSSSDSPNSDNPSSNCTYPFTMLGPANANSSIRRHSMTVQDVLNPSDEDPRSSSRSQSGDDDEGHLVPQRRGHVPISTRVNRTPRHGTYTHRNSSARLSDRGPRRATHHTSRRSSLSSSGSDFGDSGRRSFRKPYTPEEAHFIW